MSDESYDVDIGCPGCGNLTVTLRYEHAYQIGDADPVDTILQCAQCESCGLRFTNSKVLDAAEELDVG